MDKLDEIMASKRREVAPLLRDVSPRELEDLARVARLRPSFHRALDVPGRLTVIAEMKRRSPSAGPIAEGRSAPAQAETYARAHADAISVLTDGPYFGGSLADLAEVTENFDAKGIRVPCLRKDFMVHPVQIPQAVEAGASAILIIVRALTDDEMAALFESANLAGLDSIFEIHSEPELARALSAGARIIGVNNRDLARFKTDLALSEQLIPQIPGDVLAISESGIFTVEDAARARAAGARAILVGEALMRATNPADLIAAFHHA
ncbi:indole-3-glycerol phosphate synthase TrpC [Opitutales bacterium ASA1]|uniref:indole-3-glycerol phosphate synthase TrpC n=1 Tax=Congregicoccus parvus TaxID=3081749 RepID=UPI002B28DECE|nr:indole-3-glycerol phosphate synthase TrpC [Opitutales bacterium ASA1]